MSNLDQPPTSVQKPLAEIEAEEQKVDEQIAAIDEAIKSKIPEYINQPEASKEKIEEFNKALESNTEEEMPPYNSGSNANKNKADSKPVDKEKGEAPKTQEKKTPTEQKVEEARDKYTKEYLKGVKEERNRIRIDKIRTTLGNALRHEKNKKFVYAEDHIHSEEYKAAKKEYDQVKVDWTRELMDKKKEELASAGKTGSELDQELKKYGSEVYKKTFLDEHDKVKDAKEQKIEKSRVWKATIGWYTNLTPEWRRVVNTGLFMTYASIGARSTVSHLALMGIGKLGKSLGMGVVMGGLAKKGGVTKMLSNTYDKFDKKSKEKFEEDLKNKRDDLKNKFLSGEITIEQFNEIEKGVREIEKRERDRKIITMANKAVINALVAGGIGAAAGGIEHLTNHSPKLIAEVGNDNINTTSHTNVFTQPADSHGPSNINHLGEKAGKLGHIKHENLTPKTEVKTSVEKTTVENVKSPVQGPIKPLEGKYDDNNAGNTSPEDPSHVKSENILDDKSATDQGDPSQPEKIEGTGAGNIGEQGGDPNQFENHQIGPQVETGTDPDIHTDDHLNPSHSSVDHTTTQESGDPDQQLNGSNTGSTENINNSDTHVGNPNSDIDPSRPPVVEPTTSAGPSVIDHNHDINHPTTNHPETHTNNDSHSPNSRAIDNGDPSQPETGTHPGTSAHIEPVSNADINHAQAVDHGDPNQNIQGSTDQKITTGPGATTGSSGNIYPNQGPSATVNPNSYATKVPMTNQGVEDAQYASNHTENISGQKLSVEKIEQDPRHLVSAREVRQTIGREIGRSNIIIERPEVHNLDGVSYEKLNQAYDNLFTNNKVTFNSYEDFTKERYMQELLGHNQVAPNDYGDYTVRTDSFRGAAEWKILNKVPARFFFNDFNHATYIDGKNLSSNDLAILIQKEIVHDQVVDPVANTHVYTFTHREELLRIADTYRKVVPGSYEPFAAPANNETLEHYISRLSKRVYQTDDGTLYGVKTQVNWDSQVAQSINRGGGNYGGGGYPVNNGNNDFPISPTNPNTNQPIYYPNRGIYQERDYNLARRAVGRIVPRYHNYYGGNRGGDWSKPLHW